MALNREWHERHVMPKNASPDQRLAWHIEHAAHCGCRKIPASILREMERRGILAASDAVSHRRDAT